MAPKNLIIVSLIQPATVHLPVHVAVRITAGVAPDVAALAGLPLVDRRRARALHAAGLISPAHIAAAPTSTVARALAPTLPVVGMASSDPGNKLPPPSGTEILTRSAVPTGGQQPAAPSEAAVRLARLLQRASSGAS
jgi:hypothetical protein